ncbi:MAG: hypothetical protein KF784_10100 [Fimbriimonadaceae bacterium]|nr:hypothetical protein [Fimbriimonadaceae bacterium]
MMTSALVFVSMFAIQSDSPRQVLLDLRDRYTKLESLSVEIEHDFSSGLFPGKYQQELLVSKKNGFRLTVKVDKCEKRPDGCAYDYYYSAGKKVVTLRGDERFTADLNTDENQMPGYEVTGSMILSWMLKSPAIDRFFEPPKGYKFDYAWGSRTEWHGQKTKEIVLKITQTEAKEGPEVWMFLSEDKKKFLGHEWKSQGKVGYQLYSNQKENPDVKPSDFEPPKAG